MWDWLVDNEVTIAAMGSPSTYSKPPYDFLQEVMAVWLLSTARMKAVPGRKSDIRIAQLLKHGRLRQ
ncbi:MAG TPA: hypothetical protein VFP34_19675 [Microlunatus sp.]|nr:hypothetical protein [Microlunatus sp.]